MQELHCRAVGGAIGSCFKYGVMNGAFFYKIPLVAFDFI